MHVSLLTIMQAEVYASTAAAGAGTYLAVRAMGGSPALRIFAGVSTAVAARWVLLADMYAWRHGSVGRRWVK